MMRGGFGDWETETGFHKMRIHQNNYDITYPKGFQSQNFFLDQTISTVFDFAFDMTFGGKGKHRSNRSGGQHCRCNGEIFANAFQGKLAECAVSNFIFQTFNEWISPDFEEYDLGKWDSADLIYKDKNISIKSTKYYGNLLLLETKDWDENAVYIPNRDTNINTYNYIILVRIKGDCESLLKSNRLLYTDTVDRCTLKKIIFTSEWMYDFAGYITHDELKTIIQNDYILPQGAMLNGKTQIDAENYYVQAGDMHSISELKKEF